MAANLLAKKFDRNHTPMRRDTNFTGASLLTMDSPTGDKHNSPTVWMQNAAESQKPLTRTTSPAAPSDLRPPSTMKRNPRPRISRPSANFTGVLGSLFLRARRTHNDAKIGASVRMKNGLTDWNQ